MAAKWGSATLCLSSFRLSASGSDRRWSSSACEQKIRSAVFKAATHTAQHAEETFIEEYLHGEYREK